MEIQISLIPQPQGMMEPNCKLQTQALEGLQTDHRGGAADRSQGGAPAMLCKSKVGREMSFENPESLSGWICSQALSIQMFVVMQADALILSSIYFYFFYRNKAGL